MFIEMKVETSKGNINYGTHFIEETDSTDLGTGLPQLELLNLWKHKCLVLVDWKYAFRPIDNYWMWWNLSQYRKVMR